MVSHASRWGIPYVTHFMFPMEEAAPGSGSAAAREPKDTLQTAPMGRPTAIAKHVLIGRHGDRLDKHPRRSENYLTEMVASGLSPCLLCSSAHKRQSVEAR